MPFSGDIDHPNGADLLRRYREEHPETVVWSPNKGWADGSPHVTVPLGWDDQLWAMACKARTSPERPSLARRILHRLGDGVAWFGRPFVTLAAYRYNLPDGPHFGADGTVYQQDDTGTWHSRQVTP